MVADHTRRNTIFLKTSGYATWFNFTAGGAIRIAHYDVVDDVITRKLQQIENKNSSGDEIANVNFCTTTTYM